MASEHHRLSRAKETSIPRWADRIFDMIECPGPIETFIKLFVPADVECPPKNLEETFKAVPLGGPVKEMYEPLVQSLTKLVEDFPEGKRLAFAELESGSHAIDFPYDPWGREHLIASPDIIAGLPGQKNELLPPKWRHISLTFEVLPNAEDDPLLNESSGRWQVIRNPCSLVELAKSALNLLITHNRLFAFVVGIYGPVARIYRFNRTNAIASGPFNYVERPEILQAFLWRFVSPKDSACNVVGADPTVRIPHRDHIKWVRKVLKAAGRRRLTEEEEEMCRWITADSPTPDKGKETYLAIRLLFVKPQLFSRTTMLWEVIKEGDQSGKTCLIKDFWKHKPEREPDHLPLDGHMSLDDYEPME